MNKLPDGEHLIEGKIYVVKGGEIIEIKDAPKEEVAMEDTVVEEEVTTETEPIDEQPEPEELAKALNVDKDKVTTVLEWLAAKKLIDTLGGLFTPTEKGLDKNTEDYETEIYTVYKYDKRPDVSGSKLISTSRDFCRKMVALTSGTELVDGKMKAKRLTYNEIEDYTNEFGEDAWNFRGGFYNDGTETTP